MKLKEIQSLITSVTSSGARELKLNYDDIKMIVKINSEEKKKSSYLNNQVLYGLVAEQNAPVISTLKEEDGLLLADQHNQLTIKSPLIGTFCERGQENLAIGTKIKEGDVLCKIKSLNLFHELVSDINGEIIDVLVEENSPVEFDQPLYVVSA